MLEDILASIRPLDYEAMDKCQLRLDNLTKPLNSLHSFEHLARQIAGITGNPRPKNPLKSIIVMSDHAVSSKELRKAAISVFAEHVSANVVLVNIEAAGLAMTREQEMQAMEVGIKVAGQEIAKGAQVLGLGVMCNGNTTMIIAGLVGVILGAASGGAAVVLDGVITSEAALVAVKMAPRVKDYLIASHYSVEPAHKVTLDEIGIPAYLHLDMSLGDGSGAALGMSLIKASLHVLNDMKTFGEAQVAVAEDGPGALKQNKDV